MPKNRNYTHRGQGWKCSVDDCRPQLSGARQDTPEVPGKSGKKKSFPAQLLELYSKVKTRP